jgi:hypothetical protein
MFEKNHTSQSVKDEENWRTRGKVSSGIYLEAGNVDSACVVGRHFLKRIVEQQGVCTSRLMLALVHNSPLLVPPPCRGRGA